MTSFATCAYVGCKEQIPYELTDIERPRYCEGHLDVMDTRLGDYASRRALYIPVVHKNNKPVVSDGNFKSKKLVELICPLCRSRQEFPVNEWGVGIPANPPAYICKAKGCAGKMVYHKDVGSEHIV